SSSRQVPIDVVRTNPDDPMAPNFVELLRTESGDTFLVCDLTAWREQPEACKSDKLTTGMDLRSFAESRVKDNTSLAAVSIPPDLGEKLSSQQSIRVDFVGQGGLNAPQQIQQKVDAVLTRMNGALLAARVVTEHAKPTDAQRQSFYESAYADAESIWASNPV